MLKIVAAGLLLVLAILGSLAATGDPFAYILCLLMLVTGAFFGLLLLVVSLISKFFPENFKKTYAGATVRLSAIIFFPILLFLVVAVIVDVLCLGGISGFTGLLSSTATFVFAVFWTWSLIRKSKRKIIVIGSVILILFVAILSLANSISLKSKSYDAQVSAIEKLKSLPYVSWVSAKQNIEKRGVIQYEPELAFDGLNLYNSSVSPEAYLIDMQGNVLHKWTKKLSGSNFWEYVNISKNRDLLVVVQDQRLIRLDWDSKPIWHKHMRAHHDVDIDENKNIYAIGREDMLVSWQRIPVPILNDYVVVLTPDGQIKKKVYFYDLLKEQFAPHRMLAVYKGIFKIETLVRMFYDKIARNFNFRSDACFDIMHFNSIEIIDRDIPSVCKKGDWLISIRELDLIGIVDPEKKEFVWSWGPGELSRQHHPTLLKNGNILIFDNGVASRRSRIVELNPLTNKIVWEYKSEPPDKFYSHTRGCNQRLPNGNTLITESDKGHVFEITEQGEVVWEFYSPEVRKESEKRAGIYRLIRITNPEIYKLDTLYLSPK